jgi:hypothetical protein
MYIQAWPPQYTVLKLNYGTERPHVHIPRSVDPVSMQVSIPRGPTVACGRPIDPTHHRRVSSEIAGWGEGWGF